MTDWENLFAIRNFKTTLITISHRHTHTNTQDSAGFITSSYSPNTVHAHVSFKQDRCKVVVCIYVSIVWAWLKHYQGFPFINWVGTCPRRKEIVIQIANTDQQILISIDLFFRSVKITHSVEPLGQASDIKTQMFWAQANKNQPCSSIPFKKLPL